MVSNTVFQERETDLDVYFITQELQQKKLGSRYVVALSQSHISQPWTWFQHSHHCTLVGPAMNAFRDPWIVESHTELAAEISALSIKDMLKPC